MLRSTVDVGAFGATGDGMADDTDALQAAINAVAPAMGTVLLPSGNYLIGSKLTASGSNAISIPTGVTLQGTGYGNTDPALGRASGSIITMASDLPGSASFFAFLTSSSNTAFFKDLVLKGPVSNINNAACTAIRHGGASGLLDFNRVASIGPWASVLSAGHQVNMNVDGCLLSGTQVLWHAGEGKDALNPAFVRVTNTKFTNFGNPADHFNHAIYTHWDVNTDVSHCQFYNTLGTGWCIHHYGGTGLASYVRFSHCLFDSSTFAGIITNKFGMTYMEDSTFSCKGPCITVTGDADINNCRFINTGDVIASDASDQAVAMLRFTKCRIESKLSYPLIILNSKSTVILDRCYIPNQRSDMLINLRNGGRTATPDCWFQESSFFGESTTANRPSAALAGRATRWWDTDRNALIISNGVRWN
jgi:hypothetical protein